MAKRRSAPEETVPTKAQLKSLIDCKQRLLGENADQMHHCEVRIQECREQLDQGRDRSHFRWMVPSVLFLLGGVWLTTVGMFVPAYVCFGVGIILGIRWIADLSHCLKKYSRAAKQLQRNIEERDRFAGECLRLRLETAELRRKLDEAADNQ